jgi:hypothetical protein
MKSSGKQAKSETTSGATFAIAVRDGADLFTVLRIRRSPQGDVYVNWPRGDPKHNPHASYHASGQHHQKSFNHNFDRVYRQKPDQSFQGTQRVEGTPLNTTDPRQWNDPCNPPDHDDVFEIPLSELRPEKYRHTVTVDLVEPNHVADIVPEKAIVRQAVFKDAVPWIVATLFETWDPAEYDLAEN